MNQGGMVVNKMVLWIRCNGPPELSAMGKLLEVVQKRYLRRQEERNKVF